MQIRIRHIDSAKSAPFDSGDIDYVERLLAWIPYSGGVHDGSDVHTEVVYQIVHDEDGAYVEIIYGKDA